MKRLVYLLLAYVFTATALPVKGQSVPFFDTSKPESILTFGLRAGLNSSGISSNYLSIQPDLIQSNFYWRMGGQAGAVADLHIRKFLALEVGFFYENRSYDCALMAANAAEDYMGSMFLHSRFSYLVFPVTLSFRFNILPSAEWQVDLGGYYAYGIGGSKDMDQYIAFGEADGQLVFDQTFISPKYFNADAKDFLAVKRVDMGLKIGTGLTFLKHYFIGVYYERGLKNCAKNRDGSPTLELHNLNWNVSLGYNF